jgi:hypothetical protein
VDAATKMKIKLNTVDIGGGTANPSMCTNLAISILFLAVKFEMFHVCCRIPGDVRKSRSPAMIQFAINSLFNFVMQLCFAGHPDQMMQLPSLEGYFEPIRTELEKLFEVRNGLATGISSCALLSVCRLSRLRAQRGRKRLRSRLFRRNSKRHC